jgi:hypothetical protein
MRTSRSALWRHSLFGLLAIFPIALAVTSGNSTSARSTSAARKSLLAGSQVPAPVRSVLERACRDCHSENTVWPWYAGVPPLSWTIHSEVARGRAFMNLSRWSEYSEAEHRGFALAINTATATHIMPPPRYVLMHSSARLSAAELDLLKEWALGTAGRKPGHTPSRVSGSSLPGRRHCRCADRSPSKSVGSAQQAHRRD